MLQAITEFGRQGLLLSGLTCCNVPRFVATLLPPLPLELPYQVSPKGDQNFPCFIKLQNWTAQARNGHRLHGARILPRLLALPTGGAQCTLI